MNVKQNLSILFFPKNQKLNKQGKTTIYIRVTIDGLKDEFSSGIKVHPDDWDVVTKTVFSSSPKAKEINKKIGQIKADLERHFDLVQAKDKIAFPQTVIAAYQTPVNGHDLHQQKIENLQFSNELDKVIEFYVDFCKQVKRTKEAGTNSPEKMEFFELQKKAIKEQVELLTKQGHQVFDDQQRTKSLILAVDEYLLHFIQLVIVGERSENTLEKWIGRKRRYLAFLNYRFKTSDLPLEKLEFKFLDDLTKYIMVHHNCEQNTATKYAQCIKEIIDRAVSNKWISANIFSTFQCSYTDTQMKWLTLHDLEYFAGFEFSKGKYNEIRDVYVASSFLGFAYADIHAAEPGDIFIGDDGERWIARNRQKTGEEEAVPILPIVEKIIEKYKNHPQCVRKNRLLPIPSNEEYNRCLKEMGKEIGFKLLTERGRGTHRVRYFFANVVAFNNGVSVKTTGQLLGQKSMRTTEKYLRPNKQIASASMKMVKEKLFDDEGNFKTDSTTDHKINAPFPKNDLKVIHVKKR